MGGNGGEGNGEGRAIDTSRVGQAVLALLYLGSHGHRRKSELRRAWKGFDWEAINRLHEKVYISDSVSMANSVVFTEEGFSEAARCSGSYSGRRTTGEIDGCRGECGAAVPQPRRGGSQTRPNRHRNAL